jgi:type I restriction enzyme S subunit
MSACEIGQWRETTLGEIAEFMSGGTPSKDNAEYWTGSIPWVSAKDMKKFRLDDSIDHVSEEAVRGATKLVPANTVFLLTRGMTLLNDVPICVARRPMAFNQDIKALRPRDGMVEDFLPYLLLGHKETLLNQVDLAGHGTGRLNTDELKSLGVLLPPEDQQRMIAAIFSKLDDKIELNAKMNETLETMARALFKSWFVDFDPVRAKAEGRDTGLPTHIAALFPDSFNASEGGDIPSGWSTCGLDGIARFLNGLALQKYPPRNGRQLPVIKIAQLRTEDTSDADQASADLPEDYIVNDGDVLFSWSGSLACVLWAGGEGALNQHLFKVTSEEYPKWFCWLWILRHLEEFQTIAADKATTMGHIQRRHLSEARVVIPPKPLLLEMNKHFASIVDQIILLKMESKTLAANRDALLPNLISGEIRLLSKNEA